MSKLDRENNKRGPEMEMKTILTRQKDFRLARNSYMRKYREFRFCARILTEAVKNQDDRGRIAFSEKERVHSLSARETIMAKLLQSVAPLVLFS